MSTTRAKASIRPAPASDPVPLPAAPMLELRGLRKAYGGFTAVDGVDLEVARGELMTFLGPSGSGKTTVLNMIAGFDDPSSGDILIDGRPMSGVSPHRRNIGMVFQRYTLFPHLAVGENVAFPLRVRGRPEPEIAARVKAMLALVRLDGLAGRMPAHLSGGQQQRVALARALAYDPPVLLMDEPLSALDKKLREEIQIEIRRIHHETGVTILYVTHDQEEALRLSDRIAVFNGGRIEQVGTGEELYRNPATRFVAGFVGDSNFLRAEEVAVENGRARVRLPGGTVLTDVPVHGDRSASRGAELMVRPQSLRFSADGSGLPVRVKDFTFLGETYAALLETSWGQELWLRAPAGEVRIDAVGSAAHVEWSTADSHLFC